MKLLVPSNWDDRLIEGLAGLSNVDSLYGQANSDEYGGGRSSLLLPFTTSDKIRAHVKKARDAGFGFTYVMNATCFENRPMGRAFEKRLRAHLDRICSIGVTGITASDVPVIRMIKKHYPRLKISASVFSIITTVTQAKRYEDLGVNDIVLANQNDFEFIKAVREAVSCDLVLFANLGCQIFCNECSLHSYTVTHSSQSGHFSKGFIIDTHVIRCAIKKIENPESLLKMMYIRPEDLWIYEKLGVNKIKIVERISPTGTLIDLAKSYSQKFFSGNFLDLVNGLAFVNSRRVYPNISFVMAPTKVNILRLIARLEGVRPFKIFIDNSKLSGLREALMKSGISCTTYNCEKCGLCHKYFMEAARFDEQARIESLALLRRLIESISSSEIFSWSPF